MSPASLPEPHSLQQAVSLLRHQSFHVVLGECTRKLSAGSSRDFLSAPDQQRAHELDAMVADPKIDAIFGACGGYGSQRILPLLDYEAIAAHPKIFTGFSDLTALLVGIHRRTGLVTFHGPSACWYDAAKPAEENRIQKEQFLRDLQLLGSTEPWGEIRNPPEGMHLRTIREGRGRGPLLAGNLGILCYTIGTPFEPDWRGRILCFEDVYDDETQIDYYLTQMRQAGILAKLGGVVVGEVTLPTHKLDWRPPPLESVLVDQFGALPIPSMTGLHCGHGRYRVSLPIGPRAELDATSCELRIVEPALD